MSDRQEETVQIFKKKNVIAESEINCLNSFK